MRSAAVIASLAVVATACGSDDAATENASDPDRPTIVVTTNVLGDVVDQVVGNQADVVTIMPVGADPHDFQPSAQEVDTMISADALIVNGADFEEGLLDVIDNARDEGVATHAAIEGVATIDFGEDGHEHDGHSDDEHSDDAHSDDDSDDDHSDDEHDDEHAADDDHGHDGVDPHFFTDPDRMSDAVDGIVGFLAENVDGLDDEALDASASEYLGQLADLDDEVDELMASIPDENRVMVTNHEVFGYFADRYDLEIVGTVIPGGTTADAASAGELAELADTVRDEAVPAIFADTSSSDELADTLADEVGDVAVVELYSESLGDADSDGATYLDMIRANAQRISSALAG